jgi:regulator of protease activity HflC (stomatin/prohibitin superfamily)
MTQIIFGVLMIVIGVAAFILMRRLRSVELAKASQRNREIDTSVVTTISWAGAVVSAIGAILLFVSGFVVVDAGHRGVVILFGNVNEQTLEEGFHVVNPLSSVKQLSARVEKDEEAHQAETSDTQSVTVKVITNWRPRGAALGNLFKNYGADYANKIIPPAVRESIKAEVAKYKVTELISKRPEIHKNVQDSINTWLNKYDLEVLEVAIAEIDFSEKYDAAIESKQVQEQQALQKKYELDRTVTEAQMAAAQAKGEADSRIARATGEAESVKLSAQAEADALKIRGEAQADFNRRVSESLSPLLIQNEYLKRWDGRLPTYTLGSGSNTMLMLPTSSDSK